MVKHSMFIIFMREYFQGSLDEFAAFQFESCLGKLKRL